MTMFHSRRAIIVATVYMIELLLVSHVNCCKDQCYKPEDIREIPTSSQNEETDLINKGVCYSSCALNLQV